jgi:hypothetical protein
VRSSHPNWPTPIDRFEYRNHLNRQWAYDVLRRWQVRVPEPAMTSPLLARRPVRWFSPTTLLVAFVLGAVPALTARRGPLLPRALTWACVVLAAGSALLWQRSYGRYDSLVLATSRGEHEISTGQGRLRYLLVSGGPAGQRPRPRMPAHAACPLDDLDRVPHHLNDLTAEYTWSRAGGSFQRGLTPPAVGQSGVATAATAYTFYLVSLPFPWVIAGCLALPAARVSNAARCAWRGRRRTRRMRCPACGYDLRHRPRRCPECGAGTPAAILSA